MQLAPVPQQMEQQTEGELEKLSQLRAAGVLDSSDFETAKAMVVEQAARAMILAATQASPAFVVAAEAVPRPEAVALADLRAFFTQFAALEGNATSFGFDAFSKMCASLKVELRDQRQTFEMLDIQRSGRVSFDEFLYAMAGRYMARKGELDAATACKQCLSDLEATLHSLQERGKIKEKTSVDAASRKVHLAAHEYQEGHGKGVTVGEYMLACAVPCYLCWESRGKSIVDRKGTKLTGMEAVMDYAVRCKDANVGYVWTIACYHYETRTRQVTTESTDSDGRTTSETHTETYQETVYTHHARLHGELASMDTTPMIMPNTSQPKVAFLSTLQQPSFDKDFEPQYKAARDKFYDDNDKDTHSDKKQEFTLAPMVKTQQAEWVQLPEPWWASQTYRNVAILSWVGAPYWLHKMNRRMGMQRIVFSKKAGAFLS